MFRVGTGDPDVLNFRELIFNLSEHPFPIEDIVKFPGELVYIKDLFEDCNKFFADNYDSINEKNEEESGGGFIAWLRSLLPNLLNGIFQVLSNIGLSVFTLFYLIGAVARFAMLAISDLLYWVLVCSYILFGTPFPTNF